MSVARIASAILACLGLAAALGSCTCEEAQDSIPADTGATPDAGNNGAPDQGNNGGADVAPDLPPANNGQETSYERLGGREGVIALVADFAGRVLGDPKINAYFLNGSTDIDRVVECLVLQVTVVTGGPGAYPDDEGRCRDMADAHAGLGISQQDFDDLLGHLVDAGKDKDVPTDILEELSALFTDPSFMATIVEDPEDGATIYQRVGRKPAVDAVVADFLARVVDDPKINGYFLNDSLDTARLTVCLERLVCEVVGGPCRYGDERIDPNEPGADAFTVPCRDMLSSHAGLGISQRDYDDLLGHLAAAAAAANVPEADLATLAGVLTAPEFTADIVEDGTNDATVYQRAGRKPALRAIVDDFLERVLANVQINGFFAETDGARLGACLVRQLCAAAGGPCRYGEGVEEALVVDGDVVPCRTMARAHGGATNPPGAEDAPGITIDDFAALVADLLDALMAGNVSEADTAVILQALEPLCADIVANPDTCSAD